jgi:hypothetical protein
MPVVPKKKKENNLPYSSVGRLFVRSHVIPSRNRSKRLGIDCSFLFYIFIP